MAKLALLLVSAVLAVVHASLPDPAHKWAMMEYVTSSSDFLLGQQFCGVPLRFLHDS